MTQIDYPIDAVITWVDGNDPELRSKRLKYETGGESAHDDVAGDIPGIVLAFAVQSALNALVVSGCIPPTGLPLPLVSAGNTSLIVTMSGMGVVYGVSRRNARHTAREKFIRYSK